MVFTETWLHSHIADSLVEVERLSLFQADRTSASGKNRGGGIGVHVNDKWCQQVTERETVCSLDTELLCLSLRPFYLPLEFGSIILCMAYVPQMQPGLHFS